MKAITNKSTSLSLSPTAHTMKREPAPAGCLLTLTHAVAGAHTRTREQTS